ncbi:hypothetical protein S7711_10940 [Stachybotrys chartarum IBT 7711]|uniref:Uncharacterized protein n=1 Tax=Stachybotrys chartarum (strain CBS 109288 / IBT 7711) TaxID=1280523 RepID=A0A084B9A2_STACB|nr:hypothetical protein S7711_10940 [Stachybotrys chartarum IBT 7711]
MSISNQGPGARRKTQIHQTPKGPCQGDSAFHRDPTSHILRASYVPSSGFKSAACNLVESQRTVRLPPGRPIHSVRLPNRRPCRIGAPYPKEISAKEGEILVSVHFNHSESRSYGGSTTRKPLHTPSSPHTLNAITLRSIARTTLAVAAILGLREDVCYHTQALIRTRTKTSTTDHSFIQSCPSLWICHFIPSQLPSRRALRASRRKLADPPSTTLLATQSAEENRQGPGGVHCASLSQYRKARAGCCSCSLVATPPFLSHPAPAFHALPVAIYHTEIPIVALSFPPPSSLFPLPPLPLLPPPHFCLTSALLIPVIHYFLVVPVSSRANTLAGRLRHLQDRGLSTSSSGYPRLRSSTRHPAVVTLSAPLADAHDPTCACSLPHDDEERRPRNNNDDHRTATCDFPFYPASPHVRLSERVVPPDNQVPRQANRLGPPRHRLRLRLCVPRWRINLERRRRCTTAHQFLQPPIESGPPGCCARPPLSFETLSCVRHYQIKGRI